MTQEKQKPTNGEILAVSLLPFMFSKHSLTRGEAMAMIQKPFDKLQAERDELYNAMQELFTEMSPVFNFDFRTAPEYIQKALAIKEKYENKS